ncbi:MAG: DUF3365 domain-containing protein, partial [Desulfuromonadaceae bacterium]|nr:DUF3365 domain-containing protein [Desulfuromonadaceae bacterium]
MQPSQQRIDLTNEDSFLPRRIRLFAWILMGIWTVLIAVSWLWNVYEERKVFDRVALAEARTVIERDALYRHWGSSHGGVYAPVTPQSPPNPYLSHVPERDIRTPSGKQLTLINPAYMTRQVNELAQKRSTYLGQARLTSLKPLRPENAPDPWERDALRSFESGEDEVSAIVTTDGKPYLRLMSPFITEKTCLKCHASQGFTVGSIRGGISVSIPIQPLIDAGHGQVVGSLAFHGLIWLLAVGVTGIGARKLSESSQAQRQGEIELRQQALQLEEEISERQKVQESLEEGRAHLQIVADYASNWEFWRLPDGSFQYMSPSAHELTGYSVDEFNSDRELFYRVLHPDDREMYLNHTHIIDSHGKIVPFEIRIVSKEGEVRWISHICQQVFTPEGLPWGWRASNQDITERKQMEHELFEQTEQLEEEVAERETAQTKLEELNRSLEERVKLAVADLRQKDQTLIQQARLAAMGEMINNIAHQWRQPLNNVGLIIQNLLFSFNAGTIAHDELKKDIDTAMDVIIQMSHTIDNFRNFFHEDKEKSDFLVGETIHHALEFVSS